jgi:large subunit ribosomal protein L35
MPKMKTRRATAKRLRVRSSGSIKRKHAFHSHILTKKTTKRCRNLRKRVTLDSANTPDACRALPYMGK